MIKGHICSHEDFTLRIANKKQNKEKADKI